MNEFSVIETYFLPLTMGCAEAGGLQDDAAVFAVPEGYELVVTSDTLNEGVHFLSNETPENIARKVLRSNLSDLAAMGAKPFCYQLSMAFPRVPDDAWLSQFTGALLDNQKAYGIFCSGGDTTSLQGKLSIGVTAMGLVPNGEAVRRRGAQSGDYIVVTGPIGDAALGLKILLEMEEGVRRSYSTRWPYALQRHYRPEPRLDIAPLVRKYAHAAIDISDGFLADIGHICKASGVGAYVSLSEFRYSRDVRGAIEEGYFSYGDVLSGGDDYELILAVPPENRDLFFNELKKYDLNPFVAGVFEGDALNILVFDAQGQALTPPSKGWLHF